MERDTGTAPGVIEADTPCIECGYDLGGLSLASVCPECAAPASESFRPLSLRHASIEHLRRLRSGIHLVTGACFGVAGSLVVWLLFILVFTALLPDSMQTGIELTTWFVLSLGLLGSLLAHCAGIWRLTMQEPRMAEVEGMISARRLLRASLIAGAIVVTLLLLAFLLETPTLQQSAVIAAITQALAVVVWPGLWFALVFHLFALGVFCNAVGHDLERRTLRRLGALMVATAPMVAAYYGARKLGLLGMPTNIGGSMLLALLMLVVGLFPFFVILLYAWLLDQLRIGLRVVHELRMGEVEKTT